MDFPHNTYTFNNINWKLRKNFVKKYDSTYKDDENSAIKVEPTKYGIYSYKKFVGGKNYNVITHAYYSPGV